MKKIILAAFISVPLFLTKNGIAQSMMLDSTIVLIDTLSVDYIVFADSETGVLIKKNKQTVIRETTIKRTYPFYLAQEVKTQLFSNEAKRIDWIIYKIGNAVYSSNDYGNLSNMFFKNEAFHNAP